MKFLFLANTLPNPNEGASGCDLSTMQALRELGHQVDAVWTGGWHRRIPHDNLHQLLELPRWFNRILIEQCGRTNYDVIQVSQPHGWLAARTHRTRAVPGVFIMRSHGWEPCAWAAAQRFGSDPRPLLRRTATAVLRPLLARHNDLVLRYADGVVVSSREEARFLILNSCVRPDKTLALPPGVPSCFLNSPPPTNPERFRKVLYVASYSHHKAPEVVAAVMRELAEKVEDLTLTWVTQETAHPAVRLLLGSVATRVKLRGWMPREELMELYDTHGFFLQPSHYEGYCMAFLEAMARGCCVLATNISGMGEKIVCGKNGFLFKRSDPADMVDTLVDMLGNPDKCALIGSAARKTAESMTWETTAKEFVSFCERRIADKGGR
jgi:glycosyltransferase involved in cell wall biosynthesis